MATVDLAAVVVAAALVVVVDAALVVVFDVAGVVLDALVEVVDTCATAADPYTGAQLKAVTVRVAPLPVNGSVPAPTLVRY